MSRFPSAAPWLAAVLLAGVAAGCGGGDDGAATPEAAYEAYFDAVADGDGEKACGYLTEPYQAEIAKEVADLGESGEEASCEDAVSIAQIFFSEAEPNLKDVEIRGDTATGFDPGIGVFEPRTVEFERIEGDWKISGDREEPEN